MSTRLLLVGGGKMGGALLAGWLAREEVSPESVIVVEPTEETAADLRERHRVGVIAEAPASVAGAVPDAIVLAVKPQVLDSVAPAYASLAAQGALVISIAAGKTIAAIERAVGADSAVVRSMPNTPAAIGRGMTVACPNPRVTAEQRDLCARLLAAVGDVAWLDDESLMDAVTAVSGSGPAYVFWLIECLAQAGAAEGLPADLAAQLARTTVCGAGELAWRSEDAPATLRRNVTSPGGTTAAALEVLMAEKDGLAPLLRRTVEAAARRSTELAG